MTRVNCTLLDRAPGPVEAQILAVRQNAVHHVPEFMKEGAHFTELEQRWFVSRGLGEVGDHRTGRAHSVIALLSRSFTSIKENHTACPDR
jgi:hypothetical protein